MPAAIDGLGTSTYAASEYLYVANEGSGGGGETIVQFDASESWESGIDGSTDFAETVGTGFNGPSGLAEVVVSGNTAETKLFISDDYGNIYSQSQAEATDDFEVVIGGLSNPNALFYSDSDDKLYIADAGNNQITRIDPTGATPVQEIVSSGLTGPQSVVVNSDATKFYNTDFSSQVYGTSLTTWADLTNFPSTIFGSGGYTEGGLVLGSGINSSGAGDYLYASNYSTGEIYKIDTGTGVSSVLVDYDNSSTDSSFQARGLALNPAESKLFITDYAGNNIIEYDFASTNSYIFANSSNGLDGPFGLLFSTIDYPDFEFTGSLEYGGADTKIVEIATATDGDSATGEIAGYTFKSDADYITTDGAPPVDSMLGLTAKAAEIEYKDDISSTAVTTTVTFEADNGWMDVLNIDPNNKSEYLAGTDSSYASMSPYYPGDFATTGVASTHTGTHDVSGGAAGEIQYINFNAGAGGNSNLYIDFNISGVGNYEADRPAAIGDEPDLGTDINGWDIDRGLNTTNGYDTYTGEEYNQFLEIKPNKYGHSGDESPSGGSAGSGQQLIVEFEGTDASGTAWSNHVESFGFYLMGREDKRDVYLDIYDANDTLIWSQNTTEGPSASGSAQAQAAFEYISFERTDNSTELIKKFALREVYAGSADNGYDRHEIFSIDNLTIVAPGTGLGVYGEDYGHGYVKQESSYTFSSAEDFNSKFETVDYRNYGEGSQQGVVGFKDGNGNQQNLYIEKDTNNAYIGTGTGNPILLKEADGSAASLNENWGYGSQTIAAMQAKTGGGYEIAVEHRYKNDQGYDEVNFDIVDVGADGKLDWSTSRPGDIAMVETHFDKDLDGNGHTGININDSQNPIRIKEVNPGKNQAGDQIEYNQQKIGTTSNIALDNWQNLYIIRPDESVIQIKDEWGDSVRLDESSPDNTWSRQTIEVAYGDHDNNSKTADVYLLATKEFNSWSWGGVEETETNWIISQIDSNGIMKWENEKWGVSIADYEEFFSVDLNGDGAEGFNAANLAKVTTDKDGHYLMKDNFDGSLYIYTAAGNRIAGGGKIKDNYGGDPRIEIEESWEGGSRSSKAYAIQQNADLTFTLAIQHREEFNEDFSEMMGHGSKEQVDHLDDDDSLEEAGTMWEIFNLSSAGVLNWENGSTWTPMIAGYETALNQDLDGDTKIGIDLGSLSIVKDASGGTVNSAQAVHNIGSGLGLKVSAGGATFIWDSKGTENTADDVTISITDENGATPSFSMSETFGDSTNGGMFSMTPYAITRVDTNGDLVVGAGADTDYYRLAVQLKDSYAFTDHEGNSVIESFTEWDIYKIGLDSDGDGKVAIDSSANIFTGSITPYEASFGQDLNGDKDFSGTVSTTARKTDTVATTLAQDSYGGLYIVPEVGNKILINDSWIEEASNWGSGSFTSEALAVELNLGDDNATGGTGDNEDYYQVATKQTNKWEGGSDQNWQIYAVDSSGNINWDKTIWTKSIASYETFFGLNLDGSEGALGAIQGLEDVATDETGYKLQKDGENNLYIVDSNGDNQLTIKDSSGWNANFDHSYDWGSGSNTSSAVAVEQNSDGTFSLAIKHVNVDRGNTFTDWEILSINAQGVFNWDNAIFTQDITPYETNLFNQDLDGDQAVGINLVGLSDVASSTDSSGDRLKKDTNNKYYILDDNDTVATTDDEHILITNSWGGNEQLDRSNNWGSSSHKTEALAVEDIESYTYYNWQTDSDVRVTEGYVIALKSTFTEGSNTHIDYELLYTDSNGVINDQYRPFVQSIKEYESLFGTSADLDGDGSTGVDKAAMDEISTDTVGDRLVSSAGDSGLYILDNKDTASESDDVVIQIKDKWGGTPNFDYIDSGGSGSYAWTHTSSSYAVESFETRLGVKKFLLAVKHEDTYGGGDPNTSWETFEIAESSVGNGNWELDYNTGSFSKGIGRKEYIFNQNMNDEAGFKTKAQLDTITTTNFDTDTSGTGTTGAYLAYDSEGSLYINAGSTKTVILDDNGGPVSFDWQDTWAGVTRTAKAYAIEGVGDSSVGYYKLAIRHTVVDNLDSGQNTTQWETFKVSTAGVIDYSSQTWGDASLHEADLGQDLDGDGTIWSSAQLTFTAIDSDTKGATPHLDENNNVYIQAAGATTKNQIIDTFGAPVNFTESVDLVKRTRETELVAVESVTISSTDYWKVLVRETEASKTDANDVSINYKTFNINADSTSNDYLKLDWTTAGWYTDSTSLEGTYNLDLNGDGTVTTINRNSTTVISTDTTGAQLRKTSDGSLFIKDGNTNIQVKGTDGGFVNLDVNDTFTGGSFKSEALAAQKVGSNYKIVVKETNAYGSNTDILYQVLTINSDGQIKWGDVKYRTAAELNEVEFGQDLTSDGVISSGSSSAASDTYASSIASGTTDGEVKAEFGNIAQSDFVSISNEKAGATDTKIEMFVKGVEGGSKSKYDMDVKIVQQASDALMAKITNDVGLDNDTIDPLTGLLDFSVTINDPDNHGKIVSMAWVLPEATTTPKYLKRDPVSGNYTNFAFDSATGEGAKWDQATSTLTVYVRDNGLYDQDSSLGKVRDPALIISEAESTATTSSGGSGGSGTTSVASSPVSSIPIPVSTIPKDSLSERRIPIAAGSGIFTPENAAGGGFVAPDDISVVEVGGGFYAPVNAPKGVVFPTKDDIESHGIQSDAIAISQFTFSQSLTPGVIPDPVKFTNVDMGDFAHVEITGGIESTEALFIDFADIDKRPALDMTRSTTGGRTIASEAPSNLSMDITGIYYNSAAGDDEITGSSSNDFVRAGSGDDIVIAGAGDDLIRGGAGSDQITTGSGADMVYWTVDQLDSSADTIIDFVVGEDQIAVESAISISVDGNLLTFTATIDGIKRSSTVSLTGVDSFNIDSILKG